MAEKDSEQFEVHKKRDGLLVNGPTGSDFMSLIEGLVYRLTGRIPKRLLTSLGRQLPRRPRG